MASEGRELTMIFGSREWKLLVAGQRAAAEQDLNSLTLYIHLLALTRLLWITARATAVDGCTLLVLCALRLSAEYRSAQAIHRLAVQVVCDGGLGNAS